MAKKAVEFENDDLFADETFDDDVNKAVEDTADDVDLLDEIDEEEESEGWVPVRPGEGIQGRVIRVGTTRSDYSDELAPTVILETKSGDKWRVIGYSAVLKREIEDADPQVGDLFAVKYFGEKTIKKGRWAGKSYHYYKVAVRRAEQAAA